MSMATSDDKAKMLQEMGLPTPLEGAEDSLDTQNQEAPKPQEVAPQAMKEAILQTAQSVQEQAPKIETKVEQEQQSEEVAPTEKEETPPTQEVPTEQTSQVAAPVVVDEEKKEIESIMSEGLEDEYASMSPKLQEKFREEGEKTATKIQKLLHSTKTNIQKIIDLLAKWLRIVPKANKFFLEQEAKIKADKLVELKKKAEEGDTNLIR